MPSAVMSVPRSARRRLHIVIPSPLPARRSDLARRRAEVAARPDDPDDEQDADDGADHDSCNRAAGQIGAAVGAA